MTHIPTTTLLSSELASALPLEDVITLSRLSGAREARIWTQNRIEECKKQLDALIAIQNSITLINTLPNELLMKIFASIPAYTWHCAVWMLTMGHVCRRWRAVVLATPEFWVKPLEHWTDTENDEGKNHLLPVFLKRSSPCPLQLYAFEQGSKKNYYGWAPHFSRLTILEGFVESKWDAAKILQTIAKKMRRLVRLKLKVYGSSFENESTAEPEFRQWKAESLPQLGHLEIGGGIFCRATTVPSLHTLVLSGPGAPKLFPKLLDGLRGCPALAKLYIDFDMWLHIMHEHEGSEDMTGPDRVLDMPNLRKLKLIGAVLVIQTFLYLISFPASAARVELVIEGTEYDPAQSPVLPDILPRHLSVLHMSPAIDRLFLHSSANGKGVPFVCLRGYVQGAERLRVSPAVWLHSAESLIELLEAFRACMVTVLVLDLRRITSDMDGAFWGRFFAALPHLRRLELLSSTVESKKTKRDLAEHFLVYASSRESLHGGAHAMSLAWVVRADRKNPPHLKGELGDVQQVFGGHAQHGPGGRLGCLELYATSLEPVMSSYPRDSRGQVVEVARVPWDRTTKWLLKKNCVAQLVEAAEVVTASGQLKLPPDDYAGEDGEFEGDGNEGDGLDELEEWCCEEDEDEYASEDDQDGDSSDDSE